MHYKSTRGEYFSVSAAETIIKGIAPDGGLFVPEHIPRVDPAGWAQMREASYQNIAEYIFRLYLGDFQPDEIKQSVWSAYNEQNFDHRDIAPLEEIEPGLFIQELWHGPTSAFKDMALQILPLLLSLSIKKIGAKHEVIILVATSGDTGKAALEGFKDVAGTKIMVFYPREGVSEVQKRQMISQEGNNVFVVAVEGNFDDAQRGVKEIFADKAINQVLTDHNMVLSSANSINWGRLMPQIVYYFTAYLDLRKKGALVEGERFNVVVPTGNFGNILGAFYARSMGVPINKLICAANANNVITDFIRCGDYDRNRELTKTISPSMDILVSSNLERLLFEITGHDAAKVTAWMYDLEKKGRYTVDEEILKRIQAVFWSDFATDLEATAAIKEVWEKNHYLMDPHTAVAWQVYKKYRQQTGDHEKTVIISTASPYKFAGSVAAEILAPEQISGQDEFKIINLLARHTGMPVPEAIRTLSEKVIRHRTITAKDHMPETILNLLQCQN